jgi:hypothetical protein
MSRGKWVLAAASASAGHYALLANRHPSANATLCRRGIAMPPEPVELDEIPDERSNSTSTRTQLLFRLSKSRCIP